MNTFRFGLLILCASAVNSQAGLDYAQIKHAKQATALVISPTTGEAFGTAFCVATAGYFLTNQHVAALRQNDVLTLVLNPGGKEERKLSARVVREDEAADLALLKSEGPADAALKLGDDAGLQELMELVAFGYPFGKLLSTDTNALPSISVNAGRITSLRRKSGQLIHIQVDAQLNPGNSGGPLLDDNGRVVGVVTAGIQGSGVNFAIPVGAVRTFLGSPLLRLDFPMTVPWSDRYKPLRLKVAVDVLSEGVPPVKPTLTLNDGHLERVVEAEETSDGYVFEAPLLTKPDPSKVKLDLTLSNAVLTCFAENVSLHPADGTFLLSDLDGFKKSQGLLIRDGRTVFYDGTDDRLTLYLDGNPVEVLMSGVKAFQVAHAEEADFIRYRLAGPTHTGPLQNVEGIIHFTDMPDRGVAPSVAGAETDAADPLVKIPTFKAFSGTIERLMPAPITDVTVAGNGRYLLLHLTKVEQLAVFDVTQLKVVTYIPCPAGTLVAGGKSTLVMVLPERQIVQRWRLDTFERELARLLPLAGTALNIGMGYGSDGPLLVRTTQDKRVLAFLDLQTFDLVPHLSDVKTGIADPTFRFSADGRTISAWSVHLNSQVEVSTFTKSEVKTADILARRGVPGPTGAYLYTEDGVYGPGGNRLAAAPDKILTIPSTMPAYFVGAEPLPRTDNGAARLRLSLFLAGSSKPVFAFPPTPELSVRTSTEQMWADQVIHYVPQAKLLITIPREGDRVVARYIDIDRHLKEMDYDYLLVASLPVDHTARGARYRYPIQVKSRASNIRYTLSAGPEGMVLDANGLLSWDVPHDFSGSANVIVHIRAGNDKEMFHSFRIEVAP